MSIPGLRLRGWFLPSFALALGVGLGWPGAAHAQSTAGFPPVGGAPAPAPVAPSPAPPPAYPPATAPPSYAPATPPPSYPPPAPAPSPAPSYPPPYAPGYAPPGASAPYPPAYAPPAPPPRPPNPVLDSDLRYRQRLGAYQRPDPRTLGADPGPGRAAYVRVSERTRKRHEGLYVRFALGAGPAHDSVESDRPLPTTRTLDFAPDKFDGSGGRMGPMTEIAVGFTPATGLVVGFGAYTATLPAFESEVTDPRTGPYSYRVSQLALFGPFADFYFDEDVGFHVQASPALATYVAGSAEPELRGPQAQAHSAVGFGFMLGAGYEWWIADQWSLGLLGRLIYGATAGPDNRGVTWSHNSYAPSVLLGATYH